MEWTTQKLADFIHEAGLNTYASPTGKKSEHPYRPGCEEFVYESGDWKYLDSYAWTKDGGGEEIVYFKDKPIWILNYYGYLLNAEQSKETYEFLHQALRLRHPELAVRGSALTEGAYRYEIAFDKNQIENFVGVERIYHNDKLVYECYVHGGLVK